MAFHMKNVEEMIKKKKMPKMADFCHFPPANWEQVGEENLRLGESARPWLPSHATTAYLVKFTEGTSLRERVWQ